MAEYNQGDFSACEKTCLELLDTASEEPEALHLLGLVKYTTGRLQQAINAIERALVLTPRNPLYHANLATVFNDADKVEKAEFHYQTALHLDPKNVASLNGLGIAARKQLNYNLAVEYYRRALAIDNDFAAAHNNLSNVLTLIGQLGPAFKHARKALSINPNYPEAWNNLGFAQTMLGEFEQANKSIKRAIELSPKLAIANFNMAANLLRQRHYLKGWDLYEWRLRLNGQNPHIEPEELALPSLNELKHSEVLLVAEQGMGDFIQFLRFVEQLHSLDAQISISCDKRLIPLISHLPWFEQIIPRGNPLPKKAHVIPMMSLARLMRTTPETIPNNIPYLSVPIERTLLWRERLAGHTELLVGLTWFGNPDNPVNTYRSPPLEHLQTIATVPNARFVSLQTGEAVKEFIQQENVFNPIDLGIFKEQQELSLCFTDTAAILLNLDVFITSCTVTAHLAGALGVPTWLVLSHVADWRWGIDEARSLWYPTIRIFRQHKPGDWRSAFDEVRAALTQESKNQTS